MNLEPRHPSSFSAYAQACFAALGARNLGGTISLGGALALLHYVDYRSTHDVDAWWEEEVSCEEREEVIVTIGRTLEAYGGVRVRRWGDVVSVELLSAEKVVFSFQIAHRSARLAPSRHDSQLGLKMDDLADLIAAKMTALVERGAPRDFRDIHAVCLAGLTTPDECWRLWRCREELVGGPGNASVDRARLAIATHLARIVQHRPLATIVDSGKRAEAEALRVWFEKEFSRA